MHNVTDATPVHKRAFVTFGGGVNQKTVDRYSASNPLEAITVTGEKSAVPYHVPLFVITQTAVKIYAED